MAGSLQSFSGESVMAGLVPAIHVFVIPLPEDVDARDKRGHDVSKRHRIQDHQADKQGRE